VRFLTMSHRYVGMLLEMIVQRTRPAFLRPSDNEIQSFYFRFSWSKHEFQLHVSELRRARWIPCNIRQILTLRLSLS
jgi:hypothetical protein